MSQRDDEFLTQHEAVRRYGMNQRTLARRRKAGRIPTFVDPLNDQVVLYRIRDLEDLKRIRPESPKATAEPSAA